MIILEIDELFLVLSLNISWYVILVRVISFSKIFWLFTNLDAHQLNFIENAK